MAAAFLETPLLEDDFFVRGLFLLFAMFVVLVGEDQYREVPSVEK